MFEQKKIGFIGPGVMAEAIIAGLLREGVAICQLLFEEVDKPVEVEGFSSARQSLK